MKIASLLSFLLLGLLPLDPLTLGSAFAHGPQIQITSDGGKIVTRQILVGDYTTPTPEASAYVMPVGLVQDLDFGPSWRPLAVSPAAPFGPGLAYGLDATFPTDSTLTVSFVEELTVWDGAAFVSAGEVELAALRTSNPNAGSLTGNAAVSGGVDASAEIAIGSTYGPNAHASITYALLGDGMSPAVEAADGIYRATLRVSSSDSSIAASEPYYLILNKGPAGQLVSAVSSLGIDPSSVQFLAIPEPSTLLIATLACGVTSLCRRGRLG